MAVKFVALETAIARALQGGALDAYGLAPERHVADVPGLPCRHCLDFIASGDAYLLLAYRPFDSLQPYAEAGPIFLHAGECQRGGDSDALPAFFDSETYIVRGYHANERIVAGTGQVIPTGEIATYAADLLTRSDVAFAHVRSASNNCFHCRIERA